ncbi:MAG: translation initiation factor IF-5A [Methanobacteriota archaeon]|nr:MAG: translation initiation factor IF-5A [Euryarchaeota archaeon]
MATKQVELRTLKVGSYIVLDGEPCRIVSYQTAKTGKHGSMKARVEGMGILDNQRRSLVKPVSAKVETPIIERKIAQITHMHGNTLGLMDMETYESFEATIPDDLEGTPVEGAEVEYIQTMGRRKIVRVRGG